MKVGDYVRTKTYGIRKINGFSSSLIEDFIDCDYDKYSNVLINKKDIIKSSLNIIDLIEVGDYVNGQLVTSAEKVVKNDDRYIGFGNYDYYLSKNEDIKSIVTKEQFESMEYKVGE